MKMIPNLLTRGFALALLFSCGAGLACAQDTATNVVNSFDSGSGGVTPAGSGLWFGTSALAFDPSQDNTGNGGGSCYFQVTFSSSSDHPMADYITFPPYDNLWWNGNGNADLTQYKWVQFDILWDTSSSTIGIEQFNNLDQWPLQYLPSWNSDPNYIATAGAGQFESGLGICVAGMGTSGGEPVQLGNVQIPDAASNTWQRITLPINQSLAGINAAAGLYFDKYISYNINWAIQPGAVSAFWIDNVQFIQNIAPPPPPIVQPPTKPLAGLNEIANSSGLNDRHEVVLLQTNALSWVGVATAANPVTYSFNIAGFPQGSATLGHYESYLFLIPNPVYLDNAPDWNETNAIIISVVQNNASSATMNFQYKVNDSYDNKMYYSTAPYTNAPGSWDGVTTNYLETGNLGSVTSHTSALGTWSVKFTSDTNMALIAPDGTTTNLIIPPYNAALFAEAPFPNQPGFFAYLGMQPNNTAGLNQALSYGSFSVSGTASPVSDNFLADTNLNTTIWTTGPSSGGSGLFIMPSGALNWLQWSTPATGFALQTAPDIAGPWTLQTNDLVLFGSGAVLQLITTNDISVGGNQYFRLVK